jgi:hypothetical protein
VGHRDLPAGEYVGWLQLWIWVPFVALITVYLPLLFPDGRLPGPRWRPVSCAAAGCGVIAATGLAITPGVVVNLRALRNPFGVHPAAVSNTAIAVGLAGLLGSVMLAVWSLLVRARRARPWNGSRSSGWPTPAADRGGARLHVAAFAPDAYSGRVRSRTIASPSGRPSIQHRSDILELTSDMQQRSVRLSRCPDPGGADVLDLATVSRAARGCTVIVHLAALAYDSAGSPEQIMAVNAMATRQNDLY